MQQIKENRWSILIASMIMNLCIGSIYSWSVFQIPLMKLFGWNIAQTSMAFTLNLLMYSFGMIIAGKIQDKKEPKYVAMVGAILFGTGMILTGFINNVIQLYATYGIVAGLGVGCIYTCTVTNTVKWFPDKRGLAGGLTVAGFGFGAFICAPIAVTLIENYGVLTTFWLLGSIFMIILIGCSFILKAPRQEEKIEESIVSFVAKDYKQKQMLKEPKFYLLWVIYTIGTIAGLMVIGHASSIGQEKIGLTPSVAAYSVSILALANTLGRVFWASISDKIGRYNTIIVMYISSSCMLIGLFFANTFFMFIITIAGVALSFGGFMGIFPSVTADHFGAKNLGSNYGIMFTAYGIAAFIGPRVAAIVKQTNQGEYGKAFLIASILNILGIIITFYLKMQKNNQEHAIK